MNPVPCAADPELFFSPVPDDRALAKRICDHVCLRRRWCAELGAGEVWGVWSGEDMEQREAERLTAEMAAGVIEAAVHVPSRSAYVSGCGCDGCRAENTRWKAQYERLRASRPVVVTAPARIDLQMTLEGITA